MNRASLQKYGLSAIAVVLLALVSARYFYGGNSRTYVAVESEPTGAPTVPVREASTAEVKEFCAACHAFPPPSSFPKSEWRQQVHNGYDFLAASTLKMNPAPEAAILQYYLSRAPQQLPVHRHIPPETPVPVQFQRSGYWPPSRPPVTHPAPSVSNVNIAHLFDAKRLDVLVCDMQIPGQEKPFGGRVLAMKPYEPSPVLRVIGNVTQPGHVEVADLDQDGLKDVLVADLGELQPTNGKTGGVVWLRGQPDEKFTRFTLLQGVGRVADVQSADFDGDKDQDLVVAVFGWRETGEILLLENRTTDWSQPKFVSRVIDPRHGTINVPVIDLNRDGKPDFIALISQEHEVVEAFLNQGKGRFRKQRLHAAPHPGYGSSSIQLVDFDGDNDPDVLYSHGDIFDPPMLLRPDNGIHWLENRGKSQFVAHHLTWMYGVQRAVATDIDGDKDIDVVGVSLLPERPFPQRRELNLDAVILVEQKAPGKFVRHSLKTVSCNHFTCAAGDLDGDGKVDLVTGNMSAPGTPAVVIWKNRGSIGQ